MTSFSIALFLMSAGTLMYEIVLTRLLSVISWYYLAFVSVSMGMFGMTAGALAVQLAPGYFAERLIPKRLTQAAFFAGVAMPLTLVTMLAVPIEVAYSAETIFSFIIFSAVIAVPFFFSGVAVCLSLTRVPFATGKVYFVDLIGAASGCIGAIALMELIDASSAMLAISALFFLSAAGYAGYSADSRRPRFFGWAIVMLVLAGLNAATPYGLQPIWCKGKLDRRDDLLAEIWNPISRVRARRMVPAATPFLWGPSTKLPVPGRIDTIMMDIDGDAGTPLFRVGSDLGVFDFLRYDVTSIGAQLRQGGSAAIIGFGGGKDALAAAANGFHRIVGLELNSAILTFDLKRLNWFADFSQVPGLEVHNDEGRSYMTRTPEKFDLIQASMVDTWAASSAGAMTLSENCLYTQEAWQIFYRHLKPGGLMTFSRWFVGAEAYQTIRMFSLAWGTLLAEGVANPGDHLALIGAQRVATLLISNQPLTTEDLKKTRAIADEMGFQILFLPGQPVQFGELQKIAAARTAADLNHLDDAGLFDYSPVFDSSPFFFNSLRMSHLREALLLLGLAGNLRATLFLLLFMLASLVLVIATIALPLSRWGRLPAASGSILTGGITYFVAIGMGFMLVEMGMMQQLSVFLGHPIYSLAVVLSGLIFSGGVGSLASERLSLRSAAIGRVPAAMATLAIFIYMLVVIPLIHSQAAQTLAIRMLISLALVTPCGFVMGFCFPVGLRWMRQLGQYDSLPWMWALNGAASVLASFVAIVISMEAAITASILVAALCYAAAALALPWRVAAAENATEKAASIFESSPKARRASSRSANRRR
jgi:hypothetical protein